MALIQELKDSKIAVKGIRPEGDKIMRMTAETARLEAGVLHVPGKAPWLDDLRTELLAFPHGADDDQIDALSQALKWVRTRRQNRGGGGFHRGAI